jgi:hypothetical protein
MPGKSGTTHEARIISVPVRWALGAMALLSVYLIAQTLVGVAALIYYPLEANFGEGVVLTEARRLFAGEAVYRSLQADAWSATYPPLGLWYLGFSLGSPYSDLVLPRFLALFAMVGSGFVLGSLLTSGLRRHPSYLPLPAVCVALVAMACWIASPFVGEWLAVVRVDAPGRLLAVGSIALTAIAIMPSLAPSNAPTPHWARIFAHANPFRFFGKLSWAFGIQGIILLGLMMAVFFAQYPTLSVVVTILFLVGLISVHTTHSVELPEEHVISLVAAGLLAGLALFTKQSLIAPALVVGFAPLVCGLPRKAWLGILSCVVSTVILYGVLHWETGGWSTMNLTRGTARGLDTAVGFSWWMGFLLTHGALLLAAGFGYRVWMDGPLGRILGLAFLAGLPHALLAANSGADRNYFFDVLWPLCGLAALGVWQSGWQGKASLACVGLHLVIVALFSSTRWPTGEETQTAQQFIAKYRAARPAIEGPVLSEYVQWGTVLGSNPVFLPYLTAVMAEQGQFDPTSLVAQVDSKQFRYVFTTSQAPSRFPRAVLGAVTQAYEPQAKWTGLYLTDQPPGAPVVVWVPKPVPSSSN